MRSKLTEFYISFRLDILSHSIRNWFDPFYSTTTDCLVRNVIPYKSLNIEKLEMNEASFRWAHNEDAMATEKLAEGIQKFHIDYLKLKKFISDKV